MRCPACETDLTEKTVDGIVVDVCVGGCGGIWFDQFELKKFDEPHEEGGVELLDVEESPDIHVDHEKQHGCPRCDGNTPMLRHFWSVKHEVEVDECPTCAGFWLDAGELRHLRSLYSSEEDRKVAAEKYFDDLFGPQLETLRKESDERKKKFRTIAGMFKFICPSYYIPGKQDWGAF